MGDQQEGELPDTIIRKYFLGRRYRKLFTSMNMITSHFQMHGLRKAFVIDCMAESRSTNYSITFELVNCHIDRKSTESSAQKMVDY